MTDLIVTDEERQIYDMMAKNAGVPFLAGSLAELATVESRFVSKKPIQVFLLDGWRCDTRFSGVGDQFVAKLATDETGREYYISASERREPKLHGESRKYRYLTAWTKRQFKHLRRDVDDMFFPRWLWVERYFFEPMVWEGKPIRAILYDIKARTVYFQPAED